MYQDQPLVDHVPRPGWDRLGSKVDGTDFEVRVAVGPAPAGIEVYGEHTSGGSDLVGHPSRDRAAAGAHLQAPCARRHSQSSQVVTGDGVEHGL
jgi:hypothetical protein